jgi:CubicO group peptidase (beta-lactamase class C family)
MKNLNIQTLHMKIRPMRLIAIIAIIAFFQPSCVKEEVEPPLPPAIDLCEPTGRCFSTEQFAQNLHQMEDVGFAFSIYAGERLMKTGQGGLASRAGDPMGQVPFKASSTRMHLASVSKSITAIATLQILRQKGISIDAKIIDWLPGFWVKGPHIDQITFRDLLTHRSGLRELHGEHDFDGLELLINRGVQPQHRGIFWYQNDNYSLLRVLIASLNGADFFPDYPLNDYHAGTNYHDFVQQYIMAPLGITNASLRFDGNTALIYNYPYNNKRGVKTTEDFTNIAGAFGWYLDAVSVGKIFSALANSEKLLPVSERQKMFDGLLGCFPYYGTSTGTAYNHN